MMHLFLFASRDHALHVTRCFFSPCTTFQHLSLEIGRCSSIHTRSPTPYSLVSSWAWYFFDRRTVFFSTGWVKRRSTRTITVLSCLSLTTVPWSIRFGISRLLTSSLARAFAARSSSAARCRGAPGAPAPYSRVGPSPAENAG